MMHSISKTLFSTLSVAAFAVSGSAALAENVTLKAKDGSFEITGDLVDYDGTRLQVETSFGVMNVDAATVAECIGAACPVFPVEWDVSLWGKRRAFTEHIEKLAELVDARTDGKFKLTLHYGGLSDSRENLEGISQGAFEMAQFCAGYHPEKNPSITVLELPFLGVTSLEQEIDLSFAVYEHPATVADMARWNATLLMPSPLPQYNIIGVGLPPASLDAFGDMTVRATGGVGRAIRALGADVVNLPATQVGDALQAQEIGAVAFAPHAHMAFGTIESGSWWTTNLNPGTTNCPVVVNSDALDALPEAFRTALTSSVDEALDHYVDNYNGQTMTAWGPALDEQLVVQISINEDILAEIDRRVAGPAAAAWVSEFGAGGFPSRELYQLVLNVLDEQS